MSTFPILTLLCGLSSVCSDSDDIYGLLRRGVQTTYLEELYQKFSPKLSLEYDAVTCAALASKHYYHHGRRLVLVCPDCGPLEAKITHALMLTRPLVLANRPTLMKNERTPGFMLIERSPNLSALHQLFRSPSTFVRRSQSLVISTAAEEAVLSALHVAWKTGFRDMAIMMFNGEHSGTIVWGNMRDGKFVLDNVGRCKPLEGRFERKEAPSFFRQLCPDGPCSLTYGSITDDAATVKYWRGDGERQKKKGVKPGYETIGGMLIRRFGGFYNVSVRRNVYGNTSWAMARKRMLDGQTDVFKGLVPRDMKYLEDVEIVCWYRHRNMVFAARVHYRSLGNDMFKLLLPFSLSVWMCIISMAVVYLALVRVLRRLSSIGLIGDRLTFMQICSVTLAQSVTYPKNMGLRLVLAIWMLFSLHLNIVYNSTFTSSLARLDSEDQLQNLKDLVRSGQPVGGPGLILSYFRNVNDPVVEDLHKRYRVMDSESALEAIFSENMVGVVQHFTVDKLNWKYKANISMRLYTMPEPVLKIPVFFFVRKGHSYRHPFRRVVTRSRETGLLDQWVKSYLIDEDRGVTQEFDNEILNLTHLSGIFHLFLVCHAFSTVVFIIELNFGRIRRLTGRLTEKYRNIKLLRRPRRQFH